MLEFKFAKFIAIVWSLSHSCSVKWSGRRNLTYNFLLSTSGPTNFIYAMCIYKYWAMYIMRSNPSGVSVLLLVIVNMLVIVIIITWKTLQKYIFYVNFALSQQSNYIHGNKSPRM